MDIAVPSGAFGNALGCCFAKRMLSFGAIRNVVPCTNEYDIVHRTISLGDFSVLKDNVFETLSPAMDTLIPYNLERYFWMVFDGDCDFVRSVMTQFEQQGSYQFDMENIRIRQQLRSLATFSVRVRDGDIESVTIQWVRDFGYLPCPHSATGIYGAMEIQKRLKGDDISKVIAVGTAHPAKFPKIISGILNKGEKLTDKVRERVHREYMGHHFLPGKEDKRAFVKLQGSIDWETKWMDIIKSDIMRMRVIQSKL